MASALHAQSVAAPVARPRRRAKQKHARAGIVWIVVGGILLAGVVFVNVAVLQLNLRLDSANAERSKLLAENAALQTDYSRLISSPRISAAATRQLGLVYSDPSNYVHVDLAGR